MLALQYHAELGNLFCNMGFWIYNLSTNKMKSSAGSATSARFYINFPTGKLFGKLEFQGPYGPLKNSSPCAGHARYARMASRFTQRVTLENLDFLLQTHRQTLENFIIRYDV